MNNECSRCGIPLSETARTCWRCDREYEEIDFLEKVAQFIYDTIPEAFEEPGAVWDEKRPEILYRDKYIAVIRENVPHGGYRTNLVMIDWTSSEEDKIWYVVSDFDFTIQVHTHETNVEFEIFEKGID